MGFDKFFVKSLRDKISITELVSKYIPLTKKGTSSWGCCPFHSEKTASFSVCEDKNFYHCFGCGAHGDVVSFIMQIQHISFIEAVEQLCHDFQIEIPTLTEDQRKKDKEIHALYEIFNLAFEFYKTQLHTNDGEQALKYLANRQISENMILNFGLCYAPKGKDLLIKYLNEKNIPTNLMLKAGLVRHSAKTNNLYDYFQDRVLFPITDSKGRVIAFGGRIMTPVDNLPKYLNSPESLIFSKGKNLYGLAQARIKATETKQIIVTEGYMDCITLHQFGFNMSVASLGTALTEIQVELLWKFSASPILCFDSDEAGRNAGIRAALRVLPILKPGYSVRFCLLEGAKDPDEFLHIYGADKFKEVLNNKCINLADILWLYFTSNKQIQTPEQRAGLEETIQIELAKIKSETVKNFYQQEFKFRMQKHCKILTNQKKKALPNINTDHLNEKMILAYAVVYPSVFTKFLETGKKIELTNVRYKKILDEVIREISVNLHTHETIIKFLNSKGYKVDLLLKFEIESLLKNSIDAEKLLTEKIMNYQLLNLKNELTKLNKILLQANTTEEETLKNKISLIKNEISSIQQKLLGDFD